MDLKFLHLVGELVLSWPTVALVAVIALRSPLSLLIRRYAAGESGTVKLGILSIELGKLAQQGQDAVGTLEK